MLDSFRFTKLILFTGIPSLLISALVLTTSINKINNTPLDSTTTDSIVCVTACAATWMVADIVLTIMIWRHKLVLKEDGPSEMLVTNV